MSRLKLTLLGGFDADTGESEPIELPIRKVRALLAWLAVNADRRLARETAVGLLWSDSPQKQANASLSQALYSLRRALAEHGCDPIDADKDTITFDSQGAEVDVLRFARMRDEGAQQTLEEAARLYGGDFLRGFPAPTHQFEEWMEGERRRLRHEAIDVLTALLEARSLYAAEMTFADTARRLAELDPYSETACRALMLHHALRGQIGAATEAFEILRDRLCEELGTVPSEATVQQHSRILRREIEPPPRENVRPHAVSAISKPPAARATGRLRASAGVFALTLAVLAATVWWQPWTRSFEAVDPASMAHPLPAKPSIGVLPFDDLSQGQERGYLSDAIAEGIITQLSRFPELFVIARNSSFHYRGTPMELRGVARELGVRYLLEGSQQKAGDRLRVTVQLIDAIGGNHVWTETYDRDLAEIFGVQDEISASVASTLGEKLTKIAGEEAKRADPATLVAYQHVLKGIRHFREFSRNGSEQARLSYLAALKEDPNLAEAHVGLAWVHINGYRWGWTELSREEALEKAREEASIALQLAPENYKTHFAMAYVHTQAGEREEAIVEFEKSLTLNPNAGNVMANLAEVLGYSGRFAEAIELLEKAMRLDPHHPEWFYWNLGWAQYSAGRCEEALATLRKMSRMPAFANRTLAATLVCLGRLEESRAAIDALLEHDPDYAVAKFRLNFRGKYDDPVALERWIGDLRKAGLPD